MNEKENPGIAYVNMLAAKSRPMTKKDAKALLRRTGRLEWKGVVIRETVKDGNYTGRYNITRDGVLLNAFPLTLTQAIEFHLAK